MKIKLPEKKTSIYKEKIKQKGIKLWQVSSVSSYSESKLSQILNGIKPMPEDLKKLLEEICE